MSESLSLPAHLTAALQCGYCDQLPTRAPVYQIGVDEDVDDDNDEHCYRNTASGPPKLVCADCSAFVRNTSLGHKLVRQKKLELLLNHLSRSKLELAPGANQDTSTASSNASNTSDNFQHNTDLKVALGCSLKGNKTTKKPTVLQYNLSIQRHGQKQLCLLDADTVSRLQMESVDVYVEGAIALTKKPQQVYGSMTLVPHKPSPKQPIYESLGSLRDSSSQYQWSSTLSQQHRSSNNCSMVIMEEQKTTCKNGCLWRGSNGDLGDHLKVCPMVSMACWFEGCDWHGSAQLMKGHLFNRHVKYVRDQIQGSFVQDDRMAVMIRDGIIFLFKYFFYEDFVEMLVQGVVNRTELNYTYSVHVLKDEGSDENARLLPQKVNVKSAQCLVYNKCVLQKGVRFDLVELKSFKNCRYTVDIVKQM